MRRLSNEARERAGFTVVELALGTAVLALILGFGLQLGSSGRDVHLAASTKVAEGLRGRRAIDRVVEQLACAVESSLVPVPDALFGVDELVFRPVDRIEGVELMMGDPVRIRLEYDDGELDDGIDQDGDGLIDECRIVLTRDLGGAGEREITLLRDVSELAAGELRNAEDDNGNGLVDERGFSLSLQDRLLTIQITTASPNPGGAPTLRSFTTSLMLRN